MKFFPKKAHHKDVLIQLLNVAPLAVPASVAAVGAVAMLFVVTRQFNPLMVLAIGGPIAIGLYYLIYKIHPKIQPGREDLSVLSIVLLLALVWGGINVVLSSQHVQVERDPAIYALTSIHLINNPDVVIQQPDDIKGVPGVIASSAGFNEVKGDKEHIYAQSAHMLPALMALFGYVGGGASAALHSPPIFGMVALLAVFGFARIIMKPRWAFVATATLAVSLPMLYFSRDSYTEPLLAAFTFGALGLLALAYQTKKYPLWALSGFMAGAAMMVRADAAIATIGVLVGVLVLLILARKKERQYVALATSLFMIPFALGFLLAWYDLSQLSVFYFNRQDQQIYMLYKLTGLISVGGLIAAAVAWNTNLLKVLHNKTKDWRVQAVVTGLLLLVIVLLSRPLWMQSMGSSIDNPVTRETQASQGMELNGWRDYAEYTLYWMVWYIGPVLAIFSLVGFSVAIRNMFTTRNIIWVASLVSILAVSCLYFVMPSITPDQIWAARRFLPVTLPGLAVFGALGLQALYEWKRKDIFGVTSRSAATVLAVLAITFPLMVSYPFTPVRTYGTQLTQIEQVCVAVPKNSLIIWLGSGSIKLPRAISIICDDTGIISYGAGHEYSKTTLAQAYDKARERQKKLYLGMYTSEIPNAFKAGGYSEGVGKMGEISKQQYFEYEKVLDRVPIRTNQVVSDISIAEVAENGELK